MEECRRYIEYMDSSTWTTSAVQPFHWPNGGAVLDPVGTEEGDEKEGKEEKKEEKDGTISVRSGVRHSRHAIYHLHGCDTPISVGCFCIVRPEDHNMVSDEGKLLRFHVGKISKLSVNQTNFEEFNQRLN